MKLKNFFLLFSKSEKKSFISVGAVHVFDIPVEMCIIKKTPTYIIVKPKASSHGAKNIKRVTKK